MTTERLSRRQVIRAAAIGAFALAGCSQTGGQQPAEESTTAYSESEHTEESHTESGDHADSHSETEHTEEGGHHDGSDGGHTHEAASEPTDTAEVAMQTTEDGYHFAPHVVRVHEGGTVAFVNESGSHASAAYHPDNDKPRLVPEGAASWDSGIMSGDGAAFEHTFQTPGVYHYYCEPHESLGMVGTVIVGDPDPHDQPALEEPPESLPEETRHKIETLNDRCNEILGHTH